MCIRDRLTVLIVAVPKTSALETARRELSEDVSFGTGTLLAVEQSSLQNRPRGCVIYVTHGRTYYQVCIRCSVGSYRATRYTLRRGLISQCIALVNNTIHRETTRPSFGSGYEEALVLALFILLL